MSNNNDLFTSLISDIKTYNGKDPLFPWIRGIRKMKVTLPPQLLKEKLPRFLQKCIQTFQSDRRYQNDLRYLRVWLQLMDFVDDPRVLLRTMEKNQIGRKSSLFYQAYALYYEKHKKYEEVEKMYHSGVRNHAEPFDELQRSYEQFMDRVRKQKSERTKLKDGTKDKLLSARVVPLKTVENDENAFTVGARNKAASTDEYPSDMLPEAEAEDVCHHGLVDPTINMKEAISDINRMFCEPLDPTLVGRRRQRRQPEDDDIKNEFKVFIDEDLENGTKLDDHGKRNPSLLQQNRSETCMPHQEPFCIFVDDKGNDEITGRNYEKNDFECSEIHNSKEGSSSTASHENAFVFPFPKDNPSENYDGLNLGGTRRSGFREDTVVCRFVGSTISDEHKEVENVCHHGLVDPTINLKEAMDDINNMFGKPIDFVRAKRSKKPEREPDMNKDFGGFMILPDDDLQHQEVKPMPKSSRKPRGCDLFEPTVVTKEAIDDINKMFGMPLDF